MDNKLKNFYFLLTFYFKTKFLIYSTKYISWNYIKLFFEIFAQHFLVKVLTKMYYLRRKHQATNFKTLKNETYLTIKSVEYS